ncbi:MAG: hypothetical protein Q9211_000273 [Gyalolechia sp. 1 TL-2023]
MAGASDKARFYLERSVPELQELVRKKLFTNEEVGSIVKRKSAFEYKLNARGSTASDYARYAEYEMNLESLRQKRSRRLGVSLTSYTGQRRIFSILDRATKKFHGDTALWLQYLTFARRQKANKKVFQIITSMLRLHPTDPKLWIYAADYALEERGDVTEARSYIQRGLRFCNQSQYLWSEYLKFEMIYIAKITTRRQILGLDSNSPKMSQGSDSKTRDAGLITLPRTTTGHMDLERQKPDLSHPTELNRNILSTSALSGAIPIAVFNSAMEKFPRDTTFGAQMFGIVALFHQLQCTRRILEHIAETLMEIAPDDAASLKCSINEPVVGVGPTSTELPSALIKVLHRFNFATRRLESPDGPPEHIRIRASVSRHMILWIVPYLSAPEVDSDIQAVLVTVLKTAWDYCLSDIEARTKSSSVDTKSSGVEMATLLEKLHMYGFKDLVQSGLDPSLRLWPDEPRLLALEALNPR